jgi:DNA helicase II / ATP-dependent DNA helicase PcrA
MSIQWSQEQLTIIDAWINTRRNIIINASPGSGKTTMLEELWKHCPDSVCSLAFNKNIVTELERRLSNKQFSTICTYNSLGNRALKKAFPNAKLDVYKLSNIIRDTVAHTWHSKVKAERSIMVRDVVQRMKGSLLPDAITYDAIDELIAFHGLEDYDGIIEDSIRVYALSLSNTKIYDFSDQLLFPVHYELKMSPYAYVLVDEAQDTNTIQLELLLMFRESNPNVRYAIVGDSHQAIYGFRGALSDSMRVLGEVLDCTSYPLNISRRCAVSIVNRAREVFNDIKAADNAVEGIIRDCNNKRSIDRNVKAFMRDYNGIIDKEEWDKDAMILCRTTAPLVRLAYQLISNRIACNIRGREIGKGLINYIKKSKAKSIDEFVRYFRIDLEREIDNAIRKDNGKANSLIDRFEILEAMTSQMQGEALIYELTDSIEGMFREGNGITLSTIHKAKGLESDLIYILAPELMPFNRATQEWEKLQERNIEYVAITRAKREIVYI